MRATYPTDSINWPSEFITERGVLNQAMIHVIATIELKPEAREAFLAEFHKLIPHVLAEEGCIEYGSTVDLASGIAAQIPIRDDVVTIVEKWASLDHLKVHLNAPHMAPYRQAVKDLLVTTKLAILEPA